MKNELYDWRFDERLLKVDPKVIQSLLNAGLTPFVPSVPLLPIDTDYIEVKENFDGICANHVLDAEHIAFFGHPLKSK